MEHTKDSYKIVIIGEGDFLSYLLFVFKVESGKLQFY